MTSSTPNVTPSLTPGPGDHLTDKYRVDRVLGEGGMGVVLAATDIELGRPVAIKFMLPHLVTDAGIVARFMREARAIVQIQSEHVVRVIEVGHLPDRAPYIVMEYLEGEDLADLVARGPLPIEVGLDYVLQACEAIAEAHAKGIIHRDLKPANLFLTQRPDGSATIKVLDFGISKLRDNVSPENATLIGAAMGSPMYMSPEHATSANEVDARSDVWSLGVILYELLSGQRPHQAASLTGLMKAIIFDKARPLHEWAPHVPQALSAVVQRCLEKEPAQRYQNVGELALALAPFAGEAEQLSVRRIVRVSGLDPMGASSRPPPSGRFDHPTSSPEVISSVRTSPPSRSGSASRLPRWALVGVTAGALLLAGVAALLLLRGGATPAQAPAAALPADSTAAPEAPPVVASPQPSKIEAPKAVEPTSVAAPAAVKAAPAVNQPEPSASPQAPRTSQPDAPKRVRRQARKASPEPARTRQEAAPTRTPPKPAPTPRKNPLEMMLE